MRGADFVFHLAANADVRFGTDHPEKDLQQNTIATFRVLEAMRENGIKRLAFSSTGSIYGEPTVFPTPEDGPFPVQTSLYGASKLACEGLISAYCEGFGFSAWIFRFVSILGERYTHGHVFDFYQRLRADPLTLHVLGNGGQRKSYLYVQDCIDAIFTAIGTRRRESGGLQPGRGRVLHGERFHRLDHGSARNRPAAQLCGRRAGLDRRQPVHLSRLRAHPTARMGAEALDPTGDPPYARLPARQSMAVRRPGLTGRTRPEEMLLMRGQAKWPKVLPPLTPEQQERSDGFMKLWHQELAGRPRYGLIEKFNHTFPVKHSPRGFKTTLEIGAGLGEHLEYEQLSPEQAGSYYCNEFRDNMAAEIRRRFPAVRTVVGDCQQRMEFLGRIFRSLPRHPRA